MSRIIDVNELTRSGVNSQNIAQKGLVRYSTEPTWCGFSTVTGASGASSLTAVAVPGIGPNTPSTGDIVRYFSSGASGSFFVTSVVQSTGDLFNLGISPSLSSAVPTPIVYQGNRPGTTENVRSFGSILNSTAPYSVRSLNGVFSTGDTLRYTTTGGASGSTVITALSANGVSVPGFPQYNITVVPTITAGTGSVLYTVSSHSTPFRSVSLQRNARSQPRF